MGRTGGAKAKGKAATEAKKAVKKADDVVPLSCFDNFEAPVASAAVEAATAKVKSLARRVNERLAYHFAGQAPAMIYIRVSDKTGMTLHERVLADTKKWDEGDENREAMGQTYWTSLRLEYESDEDREKFELLVISDMSQPVDVQLKAALLRMTRNLSKTDELQEWCETVESVNQKNWIVLCKAVYRIYPGQSAALARMGLQILQMAHRCKIKEQFPESFDIMRDWFDLALEKTLASYGGVRHASTLWWQSVQHFSGDILPNDKFAILFAADPNSGFKDCITTVKEVAQSSRTGKALTLRALTKHSQSEIAEIADAKIMSMHNKHITEKLVAETKRAFLAELTARGFSTQKMPSDTCISEYRGVPMSDVFVKSPIDLFNAKYEPWLRGQGVMLEKVIPLWFENALAVSNTVVVSSIEDGLLAGARVGRKLAADFTLEGSSGGIMAVISKKKKFLLSKDPKMKYDLDFWEQQLGEGSGARHQQAVARCFGSHT